MRKKNLKFDIVYNGGNEAQYMIGNTCYITKYAQPPIEHYRFMWTICKTSGV